MRISPSVVLLVCSALGAGCVSQSDCAERTAWLAGVDLGRSASGDPVVQVSARADADPARIDEGCSAGRSVWSEVTEPDVIVRVPGADEELEGPSPEHAGSVAGDTGSRWDYGATSLDVGWVPDHVWVEVVGEGIRIGCDAAPDGVPNCAPR